MNWTEDTCYAALRTHDRRFDGRLFVGVSSTGIYCRPICTAKIPRRENCTFYPNSAAAEKAGYRPCLKCRPELAPGMNPNEQSNRTAVTAFKIISNGSLNADNLQDLAATLGITDRHLRRIFAEEFGVTPVEMLQTSRLLLAKQLLTDTGMPVSEVVFASGFRSIRRFNTLFVEQYRLNPTALQKQTKRNEKSDQITLYLSYRPPYDWESMIQFLAARCMAGVEIVRDGSYFRSLVIGGVTGWISVSHSPEKCSLRIEISHSLRLEIKKILPLIKRAFDLYAEPQAVDSALSDITKSEGLRLPGCIDGFDMAIRAILGQQITVKAATTISGRVVHRFGTEFASGVEGITHIAPTPAVLRSAIVDDIALLGIVSKRAQTIISLADAVTIGVVDLTGRADPEVTISALKSLPGIGEWTAQYIAMRSLSWPDAFPGSDLGIRKALGGITEKQALELSEKWRPWRSYAVMHLWKSLENQE